MEQAARRSRVTVVAKEEGALVARRTGDVDEPRFPRATARDPLEPSEGRAGDVRDPRRDRLGERAVRHAESRLLLYRILCDPERGRRRRWTPKPSCSTLATITSPPSP